MGHPVQVRRAVFLRERNHAHILPGLSPRSQSRPVLVTCDTTNVGSRKVIEAGGGDFEDERGGKLRYWIRTGD
jgi:hypothetical protein